jgi:hypothetical protein
MGILFPIIMSPRELALRGRSHGPIVGLQLSRSIFPKSRSLRPRRGGFYYVSALPPSHLIIADKKTHRHDRHISVENPYWPLDTTNLPPPSLSVVSAMFGGAATHYRRGQRRPEKPRVPRAPLFPVPDDDACAAATPMVSLAAPSGSSHTFPFPILRRRRAARCQHNGGDCGRPL